MVVTIERVVVVVVGTFFCHNHLSFYCPLITVYVDGKVVASLAFEVYACCLRSGVNNLFDIQNFVAWPTSLASKFVCMLTSKLFGM